MKKILLSSISCMLLSSQFSLYASNSNISNNAAINLPLIEHAVLLDALKDNIPYQVKCSIHAGNINNSNAKIVFEPRFLASSPYANVVLNKHPIPTNTGYLQSGDNTLTFNMVVLKPDLEKYNRFVLAYADELPIKIQQCVASEIFPSADLKSNSGANITAGGMFFAYNDTNHFVRIAVGDFFPTEYTIKPHNYKMVLTSTNNQNVHIKE